ncbi:VOC family protein [Rhodopila sp.]|jgi:PhnB protein|uniref:VOC family protein n=1 Tax=Rhodopila sp. TaxID=2480087 RepID=UPI002CA7AF40|nr:VOC family protein [Rhodopila sp.]HVZ09489.1 VOC family protein [Rhodopila sp.]
MAVSPVPAGYHSITPYLVVNGATKALDWYREVFGAREVMRLDAPGGRIGHAEFQIADSRLMIADENPDCDARGPAAFGGSPITLLLYVPDVDAVFAKATAAGAEVKRPPADMFYGDRSATVVDPFGHSWHISTHIEDVSEDEIKRRLAKMAAQG